MKASEEAIIMHAVGIMETMTNYQVVCNENSKFLIVEIGVGEHKCRVAFNKQTAPPETDMDNVRMSAYIRCLDAMVKLFMAGKVGVTVDAWDRAKKEMEDEQ